jgi:hypothetical protein
MPLTPPDGRCQEIVRILSKLIRNVPILNPGKPTTAQRRRLSSCAGGGVADVYDGRRPSAPGTTFSNVAQKADYRLEERAALTLSELERWLALEIAGVYHQTPAYRAGDVAARRWRDGLARRGTPPRQPADRQTFFLDFDRQRHNDQQRRADPIRARSARLATDCRGPAVN